MPKQAKIPNVRFNLKSHDKDYDSNIDILIILVFRYKGKKLVWSTGEKVKPKYWNQEKGRAKNVKNHPEYVDMNQRLNKLEEITINIFKKNDFGKIEPKDFKNELSYESGNLDRPNLNPTLFQFIEQYINELRTKNPDVSTWKKFRTIYNHLEQFSKEQKKELNYEDIDWRFKNEFEQWLYDSPRNHSINNASKNLQVVKQLLYESKRLGYHTNNTFEEKGFNIRRTKTKNKVRLTFNELNQLMEFDLSTNPRLEKVRDLFIVGCYSGLRFSDWCQIRKEHIHEEDGIEFLEIMTMKTKEPVIIPFLSELKVIMEKYNYLLPIITIQKFNTYIKEVCELAISDSTFLRIYSESGRELSETIEKWKRVSSHAARRSFASNFWEEGIIAPMLMQITGHATEKQFFEYIDVDRRKLAKQFAKEVALKRKNKTMR